jgi:phage terminase large subunit-like protein
VPPLSRELVMERDLCLDRFGFFLKTVAGFDLARHHIEWSLILEGRAQQLEHNKDGTGYVHTWFDDDPLDYQHIMLMAPRNHGKSTIFSVYYPLWLMARDPNVRIVIVSNTATQAKSFLRQITDNLERNEKFIELFGNLVPQMPDKWSQEEIIIKRDDLSLKDPTITAVGTGGAILSKRADVVICDDLLNRENTKTSYQREETRLWFFEVLDPVLEPLTGKMIVVGTAWDSADLYHHLLTLRTYEIRKRYDAIVDEDKHITLWPSRWPWEVLMGKKEEMGTTSFNKAYRNIANSDETAIFKSAWLERAIERGQGRTLIYSLDYSRWDLGGMVIAMGVDLAISEKKESDFCAFAVIGMLRDGTKIPLHLSKQKLSFAGAQNMIKDLQRRFNCGVIIVESNGYQAALVRDMQEGTALPIKGYATGGEKFDLEVGLNSLAVEFENNKWILPYSDQSPATKQIVDELVDGMKRFPNGHTEDILMAVWFANGGLRQLTFAGDGAGEAIGGNLDIRKFARK